jgi:hypothetical protein
MIKISHHIFPGKLQPHHTGPITQPLESELGFELTSVRACVRQLSVASYKIRKKTILEEERFILAHTFRGFNPWLAGSIALRPVMGRRSAVRLKTTWRPTKRKARPPPDHPLSYEVMMIHRQS